MKQSGADHPPQHHPEGKRIDFVYWQPLSFTFINSYEHGSNYAQHDLQTMPPKRKSAKVKDYRVDVNDNTIHNHQHLKSYYPAFSENKQNQMIITRGNQLIANLPF
jgi:hypothetical protein